MIDTTEIKEITAEEFARGYMNPYAKKLRKYGYSIIINVTPDNVASMSKHNIEKINNMDMLELDSEERRALEMYLEANKAL